MPILKVVIVHDYLNQRGGAERVVGVLHEMYPDAPIYTLFVDPDKLWPSLQDATIIPSVLQRFPFIVKHFKLFFWLYPLGIRSLRIPECDIVLTSSSAYAKGVRIRRHRRIKPLHICYCHSPMRFAWNYGSYIANETKNSLLSNIAHLAVPLLRRWDQHTSKSVDIFIANSTEVQRRIRAFYQRDATIVHPPVDIQRGLESHTATRGDASQGRTPAAISDEGYYLVVSRLVSYKGIDLAVKACTASNRPLIVIGTGPDKPRLASLAGLTVRFLGWQSDEAVTHYMSNCRALIFPGEEDFGITPVEVNSVGKPVVAYRKGGALDTIEYGINGVFFDSPSVDALLGALNKAEQITWDANRIKRIAAKFSRDKFEQKIFEIVRNSVALRGHSANTFNVSITEGEVSR